MAQGWPIATAHPTPRRYPGNVSASLDGCDCPCELRHPARPGICDRKGVTVVPHPVLGIDVRWCGPCARIEPGDTVAQEQPEAEDAVG
jgi:hypothetical protein